MPKRTDLGAPQAAPSDPHDRPQSNQARVEEALKSSESRLAGIIASAMDAIVTVDSDQRVILFNRAAEEMFRIPASEALGKPLDRFIPPHLAERHRSDIRAFGRTGVTSRSMRSPGQLTAIRVTGEEFPIEATISQTQVAGQKVYTVIMRDVTERHRAEAERKRTEEALTAHAHQQAVVAELGTRALAGTDLSLLMDEAVEMVSVTLGVEHSTVVELLPEQNQFLLRSGVGWKEGIIGRATISAGSESQAGYTLDHNEPVVLEDSRTEQRFHPPAIVGEHGIISGVTVAIPGPYQPFGVLSAHSTSRREFSQNDIHFLQAVANVLATAIERKNAENVSRAQTEALTRTLDALTSRPELDQFLRQVLAAAAEQLEATASFLWLYEEVEGVLNLHLWRFAQAAGPDAPAALHGMRLWPELVRLRRPIIVTNVPGDRRTARDPALSAHTIETLLVIPMLLGEETVGCFTLGNSRPYRYRLEEVEFAQALAQQATLALQLTRLARKGEQSAVLEERNRMAREIHDTLAQGLTGIVLQLEAAEDALDTDPPDTLTHIHKARDLAKDSLGEARRSVWALRQHALTGSSLPNAFQRLGEQVSHGSSMQVDFQLHGSPRPLSPEVEGHLLRIGQEALTNAIKHACASRVKMELDFDVGRVVLRVRDDGRGFDLARAEYGGGFGLTSMRERAESVGGDLTVTSAPGEGTMVEAVAPLRPAGPVGS